MVKSSKERAKYWEQLAFQERDKPKASEYYLKAAEFYEDAIQKVSSLERGEMRRKALGNYRDALKHSQEEVKQEIRTKIDLLSREDDKLIRSLNFIFAFFSLASLVVAFLFISFSLTGNVIVGLNESSSRFIGLCFFVCGLIFAFLYSRKKKKV